MSLLVPIGNREIEIREYKGQRVVMFKDIDFVHERPEGTASRNFRENRERFIEEEDFFRVSADEIRRDKIIELSNMVREDIILITESGYLMLAKSLNDDLAWEVQRALVNTYFRSKEIGTAVDARMNVLEQRMAALEGNPADNSEIATVNQFLRCIQNGLDSGEYLLRPKRTRYSGWHEGTVIGNYDDTMITLASNHAYWIYNRQTDMPISIQLLWHILQRQGVMKVRMSPHDSRGSIEGEITSVIRLYRAKTNLRIPEK